MNDARCWPGTNTASPSTDIFPYGPEWAYFHGSTAWDGTNAVWAQRRGDICKYLGDIGVAPGGFRVPTAAELYNGSTKPVSSPVYPWEDPSEADGYEPFGAWNETGVLSGDVNEYGTTIITFGASLTAKGLFLPASGMRNGNNSGTVAPGTDNAGIRGRYWSSIAGSGTGDGEGMVLDFYKSKSSSYMSFNGGYKRHYAMPIRCIKD
jgi:hypothetical protein